MFQTRIWPDNCRNNVTAIGIERIVQFHTVWWTTNGGLVKNLHFTKHKQTICLESDGRTKKAKPKEKKRLFIGKNGRS